MAVNPYTPGSRSKSLSSWSTVLTLAESGKGCDGLFNLYESLGDCTAAKGNAITGTYTVPTILDGPEKVVRFGELEIGDGTTATTFTASQRCKGLVVLCDKLTVKANASLNMTGKGARILTADDPFFPFDDYKIPFKIGLYSSAMSQSQVLAVIKANGFAPWDRGTFQSLVSPLYGFSLSVVLAGTTTLLLASGCGNGGTGGQTNNASWNPGLAGVNGSTGGMGGGGGGAALSDSTSYWGVGASGGNASPYSGGSGGGGGRTSSAPTLGLAGQLGYSGPGGPGVGSNSNGGSGNSAGAGVGVGASGGEGTGGKLTIICRGVISVLSGGKIEANGVPASSVANGCGGGGSGGGHLSIISPVALTPVGTVQAIGGPAAGLGPGGAGGKGSVGNRADGVDKYLTFADMGW